ncbi:hypothetical protein [Paenibacillus barcinonensis]|nr:hypothetical protein [Paenibacillus barcinonensis]
MKLMLIRLKCGNGLSINHSANKKVRFLTYSIGLMNTRSRPYSVEYASPFADRKNMTSKLILTTAFSDSCLTGRSIRISVNKMTMTDPNIQLVKATARNKATCPKLSRNITPDTSEKRRMVKNRKPIWFRAFPQIIGYLLPEINLNILKKPLSLKEIRLVVTSMDITKIIYETNTLV